jgi:anti-anti-sigma factor
MREACSLSLRLDLDRGAVVVRLAGEFDSFSERMFMAYVQRLLEHRHPTVVFDCTRARFHDVAGLRCLLRAHRQFRRASKTMIIAGIPHGIEEILRVASIAHPITIYDALDDAFGSAG